jgi:GDPmannose 4,6-dehydratase
MKKALITGITGQDGSYLTEYLLELGYDVYGIVRRHSVPENQSSRLMHVNDKITRIYGDLTDEMSLVAAIKDIQPDEIYNLGAMSHVRISFDMPAFTIKTNSLGVLNILEAYRQFVPTAKFYQASSSEMFGNSVDPDGSQRLNTPMNPVSPYGCSKVMGYNLTRHYRNAYKLHACNGILFNHETISYGTPVIIKKDNKIDILPIGDVARFHTGVSFDMNMPNYQEGKPTTDIQIWDKNGWVDISWVSGYPHKKDKNPRIINARKSVYTATGSHPCIMEDNSEKNTSDLQLGDKVKLIDYPEILNTDPITLEEAEFLGMLVGDGNLNKNKPRLTNKSMEIKNHFVNLWLKMFPTGTYSFLDSPSGFNGENVGQVTCYGGKLDYDIYTNDISPFGHKNKKVPSKILNASVEVMEAFLNGYNLCDGLKSNNCKYKFKNFKTNSATLAAGLLFLVSKVTNQNYNITVEEGNSWGKHQFYYSINLLSDGKKSVNKYNTVKALLDNSVPTRKISRDTNISRTFITKIKNGYIPKINHHLQKCSNEIKKIIEIPEYDGWFFDLETTSGTFHAGIGQGVIHNSPRRGTNFVTNKVVKTAVEIKKGITDKLELGNLDSYRDWGHSYDYVRAMHLIVNHEEPRDWIVATGESRSVRDLCYHTFKKLGLNYEDYVIQNQKFIRPEELKYLRGDSSEIRNKLNWQPKYTFESMLEEMIEHWMKEIV